MTETTDSDIKTKIEIIYKDSNGNEHASYKAAYIAQVLIEEPKLYLEGHKLRLIAETIAAKQLELLHG